MNPWKLILYYIILLACILFTFLCLIAEKYEFAIAIFGITIPYATIFMNQDFELKKIKISTVCKNHMELYTQLSQILNNIIDDMDCLNHNYEAYHFYDSSRKYNAEQQKKGGLYSEVPDEKTTDKQLIENTDKWMQEYDKHLNDLCTFYNKNGIVFSSCVDKQYRSLINTRCVTDISIRWKNCKLSDEKRHVLINFFDKGNFKEVLTIRKETKKIMKIMKKDLGVC